MMSTTEILHCNKIIILKNELSFPTNSHPFLSSPHTPLPTLSLRPPQTIHPNPALAQRPRANLAHRNRWSMYLVHSARAKLRLRSARTQLLYDRFHFFLAAECGAGERCTWPRSDESFLRYGCASKIGGKALSFSRDEYGGGGGGGGGGRL